MAYGYEVSRDELTAAMAGSDLQLLHRQFLYLYAGHVDLHAWSL